MRQMAAEHRIVLDSLVRNEGVTEAVLSADSCVHCLAARTILNTASPATLTGSRTNLDLAGRTTVLPVRTDRTTLQSPVALETNDADDTRFGSKQIPSLR